MKEYCTEQITRLCAGGQFIGTPDITGTAITQEAHKTKATPKDRQWLHTKPGQFNPCPAGGQKNLLTRSALVGEALKSASGYSCSLGFRRWRRLISPLAAVTRKPAVLSPSSFTCSISFITSCGILTVVICDLAFFEPVAITETPYVRCISVYTKKIAIKGLRCISHCSRFENIGDIHLLKTTPRSVPALPRRLTTNQPESIEVAMGNNNTQREKILLFAACNAYVQCTAWRTSIAVFVHISAISRMRHAARNGAVFFDGVGLAPTHTSTDEAPRRPLMVSLVGERSRSLANLLAGLPIPASDATSTTVKKHLRTYNGLGYVYPAPYKTGAGRCNPCKLLATPDAASVFFVVCHTSHSMAWCVIRQRSYNRRYVALLAYHAAHNGTICGCCVRLRPVIDAQNRISRRPRMVTLAGQPQGWPVSSNAGIATPVNVTAPIERCNSSGDSVNCLLEAAIMAKSAQSQIVILPYVSAVDPSDGEFHQMISGIEQKLLDRVKAALDEAGVEWIDPRTKERSKPATTDSVEGSDNA